MAENGFVDELKIHISAETDEAVSSLSRLASTIQRVASEANTAPKRLSKLTDALNRLRGMASETRTEVEELDDSINDTAGDADKTGVKFEKAAKGGLSKFFATIKRIAMYRAIRSALKLITAGIAEGINMFVTWDKEANGSMAGAATAMDNLKQATTNLKGAFGALFGGLLTQIEPILTRVIGILTDIIYFIQEVGRALGGLGDYYRYVGDQNKELTNQTKKATGAAKELQRVLFGFDELNVLPSKTGGGGGTGVVNNGTLDAQYDLKQSSPWLQGLIDEVERFNFKTKLQKILAGISFALRDGLEWIGENISKPIIEWAKRAIEWIGNLPSVVGKALIELYEKIDSKFLAPIRNGATAIAQTVGRVINFITHPSQWNSNGWETLVSDIKNIWSNAFTDMNKDTNKFTDETKTKFSHLEEVALDKKRVIERAFVNLELPKLGIEVDLNKLSAQQVELLLKKYLKELQKFANQYGYINVPVVYSNQRSTGLQGDMSRFDRKITAIAMASGGTVPYNTGTLFYSGEAGAEVVANMGHSTGVMNVSQMQEAVANGNIEVVNAVYAMANMVAGAVNSKNFDVYMDASKVGQSVSRYQNNQARRGIPQGAI